MLLVQHRATVIELHKRACGVLPLTSTREHNASEIQAHPALTIPIASAANAIDPTISVGVTANTMRCRDSRIFDMTGIASSLSDSLRLDMGSSVWMIWT